MTIEQVQEQCAQSSQVVGVACPQVGLLRSVSTINAAATLDGMVLVTAGFLHYMDVDEARAIYQASTRQQAIQEFRAWKARWRKDAPEAVRCLETDLEALLEFMDCPVELRKKLRTTNAIERLFVEVRRRIRTMCAFTTRDSCERILFSVFDRMNTYWESRPL